MTEEQQRAITGLAADWRKTVDRAIASGTAPGLVVGAAVQLALDLVLDYRGLEAAAADLRQASEILSRLVAHDGTIQ